MSELNAEIKAAIDSFDMETARTLLRDALKEADAETYYLASKVAIDDEQKQEFLDKVIELDPFHEKARKALNGAVSERKSESEAPAAPIAQTEQSFVEATVTGDAGDTKMYVIPNVHGEVRTELRKGATVYLIARFEDYANKRWFQVVYNSPVTAVVGWIEEAKLEDILFNGHPIQVMDLPKTDWQFNKRDDFLIVWRSRSGDWVKEHKLKSMEKGKKYITPALIIGAVPGVIILLIFMEPVIAIFLAVLGSCVAGFCGFILGLWLTPGDDWGGELKELKRIQESLRSDYETMRDDQRANMAMNAAMNLGVNMVTRMTPNKQDIKLRR